MTLAPTFGRLTPETARHRRHTPTTMGVCQSLVAPIGVPRYRPPGQSRAGLLRICDTCFTEQYEDDPEFDMALCGQLGWVCREDHRCSQPDCDPHHI